MTDHDGDESRGFRVTDRRRFAAATEPTPGQGADAPGADVAQPAPLTFSTFVFGLSTQALMHLGEVESPITGRVECDMGAARHVIDILGLLREKTRNNLDADEERLLDSVLYDLRMRFVELTRKGG